MFSIFQIWNFSSNRLRKTIELIFFKHLFLISEIMQGQNIS